MSAFVMPEVGEDVKLRALGSADVENLQPGDLVEVWTGAAGWSRGRVLSVSEDGVSVRVKFEGQVRGEA